LVRAERGTLAPRILSATVLAPLPIAAIWFGFPWLPMLVAAGGAIMSWEWARLCRGDGLGVSGSLLLATIVVAVTAAALAEFSIATAIIAFGSILVGIAAYWQGDRAPVWLALGTLWVGIPCVLLLWLEEAKTAGPNLLFFLLAIVWATDIGAYAVGKLIGGPRLAPRWSPGKTWAGLIGGMTAAALTGLIAGWLLVAGSALSLVVVSAALAIVEQFGDLAESVAKRRFGVKDSSGLIPGHGGLLDRVDGLLAVIPVAALLTMLGGDGVLSWR